jgi:hypothetical protein
LVIEYNSAESVFIHPPPASRPGSLSPRTSARLGLSYAKLNVLIIHVKLFYSKTLSLPRSAGRGNDLDLLHERTASGIPLCLWGIAHSSLQKRHQVRSARFRRHTIINNLVPLPAPIIRFPPNEAFLKAIF